MRPSWLRPFPIAVLFLTTAIAAQQPDAGDLDSWVKGEMERQHIPGAVVAVMRDGQVVRIQGYGFSNLEHQLPVTGKTVFKIGSVSKQFIATGIMILAQDGKLQPSDPISKYLPEAPPAWSGITIANFMSHTGGVVREGPAFDFQKIQPDSVVIGSALPLPLVFQPNTKWQYCNICYFTLADIIRRVSGTPWDRFLAQRVFEPVGMTATRPTTSRDVIPNQAEGYDWREGKWVHAQHLVAVRPSGAFLSTAEDLAKWDAALYQDRILTEATRKAMWTPATLTDGTNTRYGYGWQIDSLAGHRRVEHGGALAGFRSSFMRFPNERLSVVVLTNLGSANPDTIAEEVAKRYLGARP